ncbi:MAG: hypothetical protein ACFE9I_16285 [Candidatus Hermodarchaeota archaeon]
MILNLFLIAASTIISIIGIIYVNIKRDEFANKVNFILTILLFLLLGILFFSSFLLSTEPYFTENIALIFWYLSLTFWIFSVSILSLTHKIVIKMEKKVIISSLFYSLMIGLILGLSFIPNSFLVRLENNYYIFYFQNAILIVFLLTFNAIIFCIMSYNLIRYFSRIRNYRSKQLFSILTFQFCFIVFLYSIYILTQAIIFQYFYVIIHLISVASAAYSAIKKRNLFVELTNKIYDFILFHKSGILLYSYNFETGKETDESLLKGSILIGINHILSNLINKRDQLSLIKMENRDIILEYDNTHGYALLLTMDHKNSYIDKAVDNFMKKFTSLNEEKLKNLNGLIDISEFRNAKEIIDENFEPFIKKE